MTFSEFHIPNVVAGVNGKPANIEVGAVCRYCGQLVRHDAAITHGYWTGLPFLCHQACREAGQKDEARECQTIDADCNDCRFFERGKLAAKEIWTGYCAHWQGPTRAFPKKWTGRPCFVHRKS